MCYVAHVISETIDIYKFYIISQKLNMKSSPCYLDWHTLIYTHTTTGRGSCWRRLGVPSPNPTPRLGLTAAGSRVWAD